MVGTIICNISVSPLQSPMTICQGRFKWGSTPDPRGNSNTERSELMHTYYVLIDVVLNSLSLIRQADVVGRLKLYCCPFFIYLFLFLYSPFAQPNGAAAADQMYAPGSVICTTTPKYRYISPTPPLIFTGGQKSAIFGLITQQRSS